jgi:hypothetical protein
MVIDFRIHTNTILPNEVLGAKVKGILDADTARLWADVDSIHTNLYPALPDGSVDDPEGYEYLKLTLHNGSTQIVGLPWIREETLAVTGKGTATITIDNVSSTDIPNIVKALASNGYPVSTAEIK